MSIPTCIKISAPFFDFNPIAWPVGKHTVIVPSHGAYKFPVLGSIAIPFPIISCENTSSFTSDKGFTVPSQGAEIWSFEIVVETTFSCGSSSLNPRIHDATKPTTKEIMIVTMAWTTFISDWRILELDSSGSTAG